MYATPLLRKLYKHRIYSGPKAFPLLAKDIMMAAEHYDRTHPSSTKQGSKYWSHLMDDAWGKIDDELCTPNTRLILLFCAWDCEESNDMVSGSLCYSSLYAWNRLKYWTSRANAFLIGTDSCGYTAMYGDMINESQGNGGMFGSQLTRDKEYIALHRAELGDGKTTAH